jgi:hypothetical protein
MILQVVRRKGSATWTRLQNGNSSRWLVHPANTKPAIVVDMAEIAAQPALQEVGRPLSLIPVGLYVQWSSYLWGFYSSQEQD